MAEIVCPAHPVFRLLFYVQHFLVESGDRRFCRAFFAFSFGFNAFETFSHFRIVEVQPVRRVDPTA